MKIDKANKKEVKNKIMYNSNSKLWNCGGVVEAYHGPTAHTVGMGWGSTAGWYPLVATLEGICIPNH